MRFSWVRLDVRRDPQEKSLCFCNLAKLKSNDPTRRNADILNPGRYWNYSLYSSFWGEARGSTRVFGAVYIQDVDLERLALGNCSSNERPDYEPARGGFSCLILPGPIIYRLHEYVITEGGYQTWYILLN